MKILMIAPQPFFEPRGTPFSVLGRLKAISHLGHEVDLITYHIGENVEIKGVRIFRTPRISLIREIPIGPSLIKIFLDLFLFLKVFRHLLRNRYDLLHTHEEASFFVLILGKFFGIRHLYDMHSSLPQQLTNFQFTRFRFLIRIFQWLEDRVLRSSDAVITICPELEKYVKNVIGNVPQMMIENVFLEGNPDDVSHEEISQYRKKYSLDERNVILYTGTFEPYQGIDLLIASAPFVIKKRKNVLFLLLGGKPEQVKAYQQIVQQSGLSSYFCFAGIRPPTEIPKAIRVSQILVSPRISGNNTPLKVYAYLQSGKPIVATNLPTHTQVLSSKVAFLIDPNPDGLAKGLLFALENPSFANQLAKNARELFDTRYGFQTYVQKTDQVIQWAVR